MAILSLACLASPSRASDSTAAEASADSSVPDTLVIGRISDDPSRHYPQLKALLDYVLPRLATAGIRHGRVLMARDEQQMASYLRRGRVDWVSETFGMGLNLERSTGARIAAITERDGVSTYRSLIFVRRDSGITELSDLLGKSVALQNANSTSAYALPASALLDAGLPMTELLSPHDRPPPGSVGYLFAQSEANIATWVHKRLVDAGAFSNLDWENLHRLPQAFRKDLVVIAETESVPRAVELMREDIDPRVRAALLDVLLSAHDDPGAREAMLRYFGTSRFLPVDSFPNDRLEALRGSLRRVREELE